MSAWRDSLERIGVQAMPGAAGFWRWWTRSLLAWVPARWRQPLGLEQARLLLAVHGDTLQVSRERGGTIEPVAALPWPVAPPDLDAVLKAPLDTLPRCWLLAPEQVLRRRLRLPAAAAARLHDVARFEIDRQTPFSAEQVYFDVRASGPVEQSFVDAELLVVPRRALDGEHGVPEAWRAALAGIDVAGAAGQPLHANLLPAAQRRVRHDPMRRWNRLLALAGVVLVATAGWLLLDNRRAAIDALQADVQARAERARVVAGERQQLADLVDGAAFFERERTRRPAAIEVWNELTRRLPEGTYLEKFSMEGSQLQLIGLSNEASSLVRRLEGSPLWHTPSLTGVLQSDTGGVDRFTITAELAGGEAKEKEAADGAAR
ncbi:PilN domain-containing protein [[Pseudomonas] boreopolis]|uniref:PilN domain-containing protein n=1 Tax=Xanthomonas boreopolis TaxID=86183 RepID=UPI003D4559DD